MKLEVDSKSSAMPNPIYFNVTYIFNLQKWLNKTYDSKLIVDGIFGIETKEAVLKALQKENGD